MRYKTTNWPEYNAALKRRGSLTIWLDPQMQWEATASGRRGRRQVFSDAAIQTCLTMKMLLCMALRQATGFAQSLMQLIGLDWKVPDFSTLCRRRKTLVVDIASRRTSEPLHLLIDSTGIKVEGEWHARKHGVSRRRVWRKIHLAIDERIDHQSSRRFEPGDITDLAHDGRCGDQGYPSHGLKAATSGAIDQLGTAASICWTRRSCRASASLIARMYSCTAIY